ncbi:MAG: O-methyltransferase [Lachnospiraceae bacterium]|nr:O-methyltransferase [Lachnospiraceae bacterium]
MIVNDRIVSYIHSLESSNSEILQKIEQCAIEENVPIIRKEMESFLRVMLKIKQPLNVLELGCAIGYSAILMSEYLPEGGHITTIENYEKRIIQAKENIKEANAEGKITLLEGDAMERMAELTSGSFDFVFMDAAKAQYINFLPEVLRLMKPGAILISDNVLQDGDIIESRYGIVRRNRTIHSRMREYMYEVKHMEGLETTIVPIGDGITMSIKCD